MPTNTAIFSKGTPMKKTALVILMAVALVFAFTAVAFANTNSGYVTWSSAGDNTGYAATPHYDYATTTQKCIVCHAAHKADSDGEALLADTVQNACVYCHIGSGPGVTKVYNSTPTNFTTGSDQAHNNDCSQCHAVHGANIIANATFNGTEILRQLTVQTSPALPASWDLAGTTDKAAWTSAFCTQCHPYYTGSYALASAVGDITVSGTAYNSHIMTTDYASYGPPGDPAYANYTGQVAWAGTPYCSSCHDDATGFPHYTTGARFMKSAANYQSLATATGAASPTEDGVCLKCHASSVAGEGVGKAF